VFVPLSRDEARKFERKGGVPRIFVQEIGLGGAGKWEVFVTSLENGY